MNIKINKVYTINEGWYKGEKIIITWISDKKQILIGNKKYTQVRGKLIKSKKNISFIKEFLLDDSLKINYDKLSKLELLIKIKNKDSKAKITYIKRYKKIPKIN